MGLAVRWRPTLWRVLCYAHEEQEWAAGSQGAHTTQLLSHPVQGLRIRRCAGNHDEQGSETSQEGASHAIAARGKGLGVQVGHRDADLWSGAA